MVRVRFAPSPTGFLHIGNVRIALINWLYALRCQGKFILRYDDTDTKRSTKEYMTAIAQDLEWLGITPAEIFYQSERFARYDAVAEELKQKGLLYPCYETAEELELKRKILLGQKLPPLYGREALKLTALQKKQLVEEGRKPHWRFRLPNSRENSLTPEKTLVVWQDTVRGEQVIDLASLSDPILIREDGTYLYTLPSVIDDIDLKISHILRGEDHITNTAVQLAIFDALGAKSPQFGHINLLVTRDGEGLSKRKGALSIRSLRQEGIAPMAIANLAVLIGSSANVVAYNTMEELAKNFEVTSASRSSAKFDKDELFRLNTCLLQQKSYTQIAESLKNCGIEGEKAEAFWELIKGNITQLSEAKSWWQIVSDKELVFTSFSQEEKDFLQRAAQFLPDSPFDHSSWSLWIEQIKKQTDRRGRALFLLLRKALTGKESGPELGGLLPLMGRDVVVKRLTAAL